MKPDESKQREPHTKHTVDAKIKKTLGNIPNIFSFSIKCLSRPHTAIMVTNVAWYNGK